MKIGKSDYKSNGWGDRLIDLKSLVNSLSKLIDLLRVFLNFFYRIKGLSSVKEDDSTSDVARVLLFSLSSDGVLKAWCFKDRKVC